MSVWIIIFASFYPHSQERHRQDIVQEDRSITNHFQIWKSAPLTDSAITTAPLPVQSSVPQAAQSASTGGNDTATGLDYMYNNKAQDGSAAKQVQDANLLWLTLWA